MATIAASTISLGFDCTAREAIEFTVEHGFRGLELGSPTLWPEAMSKGGVRLARTEAASNGIGLSIHRVHRGAAPATDDSPDGMLRSRDALWRLPGDSIR